MMTSSSTRPVGSALFLSLRPNAGKCFIAAVIGFVVMYVVDMIFGMATFGFFGLPDHDETPFRRVTVWSFVLVGFVISSMVAGGIATLSVHPVTARGAIFLGSAATVSKWGHLLFSIITILLFVGPRGFGRIDAFPDAVMSGLLPLVFGSIGSLIAYQFAFGKRIRPEREISSSSQDDEHEKQKKGEDKCGAN